MAFKFLVMALRSLTPAFPEAIRPAHTLRTGAPKAAAI